MPNWLEATPNMYKKPVKTVEKAPNYSLDEQRLRKLAKWCAEAGEIKESDLILKFTKEFGVGVATFHKLRPYLLQMYPQISTIPGEREYHYDKMNNNNNDDLEKKNNNMENKISLSTNPGEN